MCGKGADTAAVTSLIRYTLRAAAVYDPDPATVLSTLNAALNKEYERDGGRFCTVIFGLLTPDGGGFTLTLASGGHPAPLLMRADGAAGYPSISGGPFIGVFADTGFTASTIRLEPGDTLLLYTDGLTDARTGTARARYGDEACAHSPPASHPSPQPQPSRQLPSCLTASATAWTTTLPCWPSGFHPWPTSRGR